MNKFAASDRVGIILANTGSPSEPTPKAVKKYLQKFLTDKRIAPMALWKWNIILNLFILPKRSKISAKKYQQIWMKEGSPLRVIHQRLAQRLEDHYHLRGYDVCVELFLNYGEKSMEDCMKNLIKADCDRIVVLPLYPQSAYSTYGCILDRVEEAKASLSPKIPVYLIEGYSDDNTYLQSMAGAIEAAGFEVDSDDRIIFSFHSIPLNDIENGDTYELQVGSSSLMIASELGIERRRWTIGYQCRFDKGRQWLSPYTSNILTRWGEAPQGRVFFVCPNFAVDCLETLYDIEHEIKPIYLDAARKAGYDISDDDFVYVPCLNAGKAHVRTLTSVLRPYVEGE